MSKFKGIPKRDVKELFPCTSRGGEKGLGGPRSVSLIRVMGWSPRIGPCDIDLWHNLSKPISDHVCFPYQCGEQAG